MTPEIKAILATIGFGITIIGVYIAFVYAPIITFGVIMSGFLLFSFYLIYLAFLTLFNN